MTTHLPDGLIAPAKVIIHPGLPHKVAIEGPLRCRIDFFRETARR